MSNIFENRIVYHCAPALNGIKSSNLINFSSENFSTLEDDLEELNQISLGNISYVELDRNESRVLVLIYQQNILSKTLQDPENHLFLCQNGYPAKFSLNTYLSILKKRIQTANDFPHEIGVFLGYDLDDVRQFLVKTKPCLYTGYWQVYSDVDKKKKIFDQFTSCRNNMINEIRKGNMLKSIIGVANE